MERIVFEDYEDEQTTPLNAENLNTLQDNIEGAIDNATSRISAIENKDIEQDTRISAIETKDTEQDARLDSLETEDTGWIDAEYLPGFKPQATSASGLKYRVKNGVFYTAGSVAKTSGSFTENAYVAVAKFPMDLINRINNTYSAIISAPSAGGRHPRKSVY